MRFVTGYNVKYILRNLIILLANRSTFNEPTIDSLPTTEMVKKIVSKLLEENGISRNPLWEYESKIVNTKEEVIRLSNLGFDCQPIGNREWLMRKKVLGQLPS